MSITTTEHPALRFKCKPVDGLIRVPADLDQHCVNRDVFRRHSAWGSVSNSALFKGALDKALRTGGVVRPDTRLLNPDHPAVTITEGFLSVVTIDCNNLGWR